MAATRESLVYGAERSAYSAELLVALITTLFSRRTSSQRTGEAEKMVLSKVRRSLDREPTSFGQRRCRRAGEAMLAAAYSDGEGERRSGSVGRKHCVGVTGWRPGLPLILASRSEVGRSLDREPASFGQRRCGRAGEAMLAGGATLS